MAQDNDSFQACVAELLAGFPVIVQQQVVWGEMDAYQHVNNAVYFRYFENARMEYVRRLGWFDFEKETGIGPILAATQARFRRPLTYPDSIAIGVRVADIGTDRLLLEQVIVSKEQRQIATEGQATLVTYHYGRQEKVPVPEELRRRITELQGKR